MTPLLWNGRWVQSNLPWSPSAWHPRELYSTLSAIPASRPESTTAPETFGRIVKDQPRGPLLSGSYFWVVCLLIGVAVLFAILAVILSLYVDSAGGTKETVKDSIGYLWHCVALLVGGLVGLLAGPRLAQSSLD